MTPDEFLYQFDVLYNNTTSNQAPGLNGYEKSVFLTKAQYEVLKNYFNPKSNKLGEGFDDSPKRHVDFSTLISESTDKDNLPAEMLFILEETCKEGGEARVIVPISYDEYQRVLSTPYPYPLKRQIWRLTGEGSNTFIKHPGNLAFTDYKLRYVRRPNPIIVGPKSDFCIDGEHYITIDSFDIDGWDGKSTSINIETPEELHQEILQRAVELAKIAWLGDVNSTLVAGQRNE